MPNSFKHNIDVLGMGQATHEQCWYASYKMILTFLKRNTNEVEDKLRAGGIDFDDAMSSGLADTNYQKAANALGLKGWAGSAFNKAPGFFDIGLTDGAEAFIDKLTSGPLWVSRILGPGSYHIVVAVGYNDSESKIIYNNPYPGPTNAVELEWKANLFVKFITAAACSVQSG
jgi:hypothetical protein